MARGPPRATLFPYTTLFRSPASSSTLPYPWCRSLTRSFVYAMRRCSRALPSLRYGGGQANTPIPALRSEEHTSELQSLAYLVCRLLLEKKNTVQPRHLDALF